MFNKEDMMVSLLVAEEKVFETKKQLEEEKEALKDNLNAVINGMKESSTVVGYLGIHRWLSKVGINTGMKVEGVDLYTGDEVVVGGEGGRRGIIHLEGSSIEVRTNADIYDIVSETDFNRNKLVFHSRSNSMISVKAIKITKHFNTLKVGEEIAKGRLGAGGFIFQETDGEV